MSIYINDVAVTEFDDLVHATFQAKGFKLDGAVRTRRGVVGKDTQFSIIRPGLAQQKALQDDVTPMNVQYNKVLANLQNWVAPEYSDIFGQREVNFDEISELSQVIHKAIGRRADQEVLDALEASATSKVILDGGAGFTYEKFLEAYENLDEDAVDTEDRYLLIPARAATQLLQEQEFISSDFVRNQVLNRPTALDGQEILGFKIKVIPNMTEGGLPKTGDIVTCYAFQKNAVGLAVGMDFSTEVNYVPVKTSFLATGKYRAGAVAIDDLGIVKVNIDITK